MCRKTCIYSTSVHISVFSGRPLVNSVPHNSVDITNCAFHINIARREQFCDCWLSKVALGIQKDCAYTAHTSETRLANSEGNWARGRKSLHEVIRYPSGSVLPYSQEQLRMQLLRNKYHGRCQNVSRIGQTQSRQIAAHVHIMMKIYPSLNPSPGKNSHATVRVCTGQPYPCYLCVRELACLAAFRDESL